MRRIGRVVGVVDARRVDADEAHSQIQEKVRPGSRQSGAGEQIGGRAPLSLPPSGAKHGRVPFTPWTARPEGWTPRVVQVHSIPCDDSYVADATPCY